MSTEVQQRDTAPGRRFGLWHLSIVLVVLGLLVSGYLSYTHLTSTSIVCVEGGAFDCDTVNSSIYSKLMGIPVAYLGFGADLFLLVVLLFEPRVKLLSSYGVMITFGVALLGFIYHSYLTYVSLTRIGALCPWCLAHHGIMLLLLIATSIRLYRSLFGGEPVEG